MNSLKNGPITYKSISCSSTNVITSAQSTLSVQLDCWKQNHSHLSSSWQEVRITTVEWEPTMCSVCTICFAITFHPSTNIFYCLLSLKRIVLYRPGREKKLSLLHDRENWVSEKLSKLHKVILLLSDKFSIYNQFVWPWGPYSETTGYGTMWQRITVGSLRKKGYF